MTNDDPILELRCVTRTFPGVVALADVSFALLPGEVHALVGENGAGKSTLINLISGVLAPDSGELLLAGRPVTPANAVVARELGIVTVHQEADFFPTLSIAENLALLLGLPTGRGGFVDWKSIHVSAQPAADVLNMGLDVKASAASLSVAQRHMLQLAAAVRQRAKVVILDEPTSSLTAEESKWLFQQIEQLKESGTGIIYISHRQDEIFSLADRITVLRDGKLVWTQNRSVVDERSLIVAMVGREVEDTCDRKRVTSSDTPDQTRSARLEVRELTDEAGDIHDVDITVHSGEVVGVYGLIGAGRTETAQAIFGLNKLKSGLLKIDGAVCSIRSPQDAVRFGIALVPEDRLQQGLFRGLSIRANTVIAALRHLNAPTGTKPSWIGIANRQAEQAAASETVDRLAVRCRSIEQPVRQLSGGNQQKVVLGRWLLTDPKVLILDEPTRGVDVGARAEIHRHIREIADRGCGVLMISSDLSEILQRSDRILVMREGRVVAEFASDDATAEAAALAASPESTGKQSSHAAIASESAGRAPRVRTKSAGEPGLFGLVVLLSVWLTLTSDGFLTSASIGQLLADTALWSLLGLAAAAVIVTGAIDISIGSLLALSAACAGLILKLPLPPVATIPLAICVSLCVGTCGGLVNGALSIIGRVHPIVVTLGMMIVYRGLVIALLSGNQISYLPESFGLLAINPETGLRGSIAIGILAALAMAGVLNFTRPGRHLYAVGASHSAAHLAGISHLRATLTAFALCGLLTGLAAIVELSSSMQMQSQLGKGWELQAIAVAVIGGVSITGGRGTVSGVVLGALLLRLVNSALVRWEIKGEQTDVVVGGLILAAVLFDTFWRRRTP